MGLATEKLVRWVAMQTADITAEGSVSYFELLYTSHHGRMRLEVFDLSEAESELDASELANLMFSRAEDDSAERDGPSHRYELLAWRNNKEEHDSAFGFRITGRLGYAQHGETEPPTETGLVGQLMRHLEETHRTSQRVVESSTGALVRDLENERTRRLRLEQDHNQILELKAQLVDNLDEREARKRVEEQKAAHRDAAIGMFLQNLPMLLGALATGLKSLGTQKNSEVKTSHQNTFDFKEFAQEIGLEKLSKILEVLNPEHQAKVLALLDQTKTPEAPND